MKEEMKKWQTQSNKNKVCFYLITRGIAFSSFVKRMFDALVTAYGCSLRPSINEVK